MEYIKKVFRSYWILSIFCVVLGIALIIDPNFFTYTSKVKGVLNVHDAAYEHIKSADNGNDFRDKIRSYDNENAYGSEDDPSHKA